MTPYPSIVVHDDRREVGPARLEHDEILALLPTVARHLAVAERDALRTRGVPENEALRIAVGLVFEWLNERAPHSTSAMNGDILRALDRLVTG